MNVDDLAQEIRRVDGNHSLGACQLAEALMPFIEAALSAAPQPVAVKGLEWELFSEQNTIYRAKTLSGFYSAWVHEGQAAWSHDSIPGCYHVGSLEEAKAAAEAHWQASIASVLTTPPTPTAEEDLVAAREAIKNKVRQQLEAWTLSPAFDSRDLVLMTMDLTISETLRNERARAGGEK